jgi:DNA repair exonuclease SbcCD ATPase subunit
MSQLDDFQAILRERFESLGEQLVADAAPICAEIDDLRSRIAAFEAGERDRNTRLRQLEDRASGQHELIETLRQEAQESCDLRETVRQREIELERCASELDSKRELIAALRRQLAEAGELRSTITERERTIAAQRDELDRNAGEIGSLRAELESRAAEPGDDDAAIDQSELAALRAELEARKAQIRALGADVERVAALEAQIDDSRLAVAALEDSIEQHIETIAGLKRSVSTWKQKYEAAKGELVRPADSSGEIPSFTDSEVEVLAELERETDGPERTVTIDMSQALLEARRRRTARAEP